MDDAFIAAATRAFRERLIEAVARLRVVRTPKDFCEAERAVRSLAQEVAADLVKNAVQEVSEDKTRYREALAAAREKAAARGIELQVERLKKKTLFRTAGGTTVEMLTPYAVAKPRADAPLETRGKQGTGVYPVLDELGIVGRSTPAARLLVSRAVCEGNSVASARDLLESAGVMIDHKAALRLTYLVADDALRHRKQAMRTQTPNDNGEMAGKRVVVSIDGGRINSRRRVGGRPKKGGRKRFETDLSRTKGPRLRALRGLLARRGRRDAPQGGHLPVLRAHDAPGPRSESSEVGSLAPPLPGIPLPL